MQSTTVPPLPSLIQSEPVITMMTDELSSHENSLCTAIDDVLRQEVQVKETNISVVQNPRDLSEPKKGSLSSNLLSKQFRSSKQHIREQTNRALLNSKRQVATDAKSRKAQTLCILKRKLYTSCQSDQRKKARLAKKVPSQSQDPQKRKEKEFLSEIDPLTLALRMGYSNPCEKDIDRGGSKDEQEDEEMSRKLSPVENIEQVIEFKSTCSCTCLNALTVQDIASHRFEIASLDRQGRDYFVMGLFRSSAVPNSATSKNCDRQRYRFHYRILNTRMCQLCFLFVNNIGAKYMKNLKKHYFEVGVKPRSHGNQGRKPHHALQISNVEDVTEFILGYADTCGVPAPRLPKSAKSKRIIRLPASDTFTSVHKRYNEMCGQTGKRGMAVSTFRKIWSSHASHVKVMKQKIVKDSVSSTALQSNQAQPQQKEKNSSEGQQNLHVHDNVKTEMKTKVKEASNTTIGTHTNMQLPAPPIPSEPSVPPQSSIPFDMGSVDMAQPPPWCPTSWQHNLLLPTHSHMHNHSSMLGQSHMATNTTLVNRTSSVPRMSSIMMQQTESSTAISSPPASLQSSQRAKYSVPVQAFPQHNGQHTHPW